MVSGSFPKQMPLLFITSNWRDRFSDSFLVCLKIAKEVIKTERALHDVGNAGKKFFGRLNVHTLHFALND